MHTVSVQSTIKPTYAASATFTPAATATDMVTAVGSATKVVTVISLRLTTTNTAAGSQQILVIKRFAVDTTGTFVAGTAVPLDSSYGAATAVVGHYTANPGALGTAVGTINTIRLASPAAVPASFAGVVVRADFEMLPIDTATGRSFPVVLRGVAETLAINFAGAALVIVWTEE